ncbi:hypothetical protein Q9Q95_10540 [Sphingomonas sp. DG1-23]|uniref:hypothetical protein n=1 Tax=Sphingomonas sp. DG1-23 TaxID=3068316 RepID=UPI00273E5E78|nr:hypothetical protein [Sphingomonas sp. DG1-23]MDP5279359.1 hypothetical protein [Sphingomonas sp. DG1-23]
MDNLIRPWSPLPDLPQLPCGIDVAGGPERVTLRAIYSFYGHERDLQIDFLEAEIFGCFSELASPLVTVADDYPRLKNHPFARYLWPMMEVMNSSWLSSHRENLWTPDRPYKHYRVVSDDGSFDVLTPAEPTARWTLPQV